MALVSLALPLVAQEPETPSSTAVRIDPDSDYVYVDGILNEPIWNRAPVISDFRQIEPNEGSPATEPTEVRVLYDANSIYVGIIAYDSNPEGIIARILQRDRVMNTDDFTGAPQFAGDDAVAILFDTFHDRRNAVVFATNPNGAEFEALLTDEGREFNIDWRGIWRVKAQKTADGWSAEFAIPFRTLRYPVGETSEPWGFNVYRVIRRKNEEVLWTAWTRGDGGFHRVSMAGHLEGMTDLPRKGLNLDLKPYVLGRVEQEAVGSEVETDPDLAVGLDAKYEVRPGLVLDLTLNTDFAQVEADDEQVNLTRFDLFFPEKREFFLENAGIFEFGVQAIMEPPPFLLFFSRRIGISDDGEIPLIGGVRLTGRVGKQTVGILDVVTDSAFADPRTNFAVVRVKRDVGARNYVGAMLTDRRWAAGSNTAGGVDFSFWPTGALNLQGFAAATTTTGPGGDDVAYRLGVDWQTDRYGLNAQHISIGPETTADVGFITRTDIRRTEGFVRYTPRPQAIGLRKVDLFAAATYISRIDGLLQDWSVGGALSPEWNSGENITVFGGVGFTRLDEGFDLSDDVFVPTGDYDLWQIAIFANTSFNRPVTFAGDAFIQGIYDGNITTASGNLGFTPNANVSITLRYTRNWVDVPDGSFIADIAAIRMTYAFSTRLVANALLQYNSLDNALSANVRLNFVHSPGSDLFIVFNEFRGNDTSRWAFSERAAVVKVTYLKRF
jgi:CBS domain-containing protein